MATSTMKMSAVTAAGPVSMRAGRASDSPVSFARSRPAKDAQVKAAPSVAVIARKRVVATEASKNRMDSVTRTTGR